MSAGFRIEEHYDKITIYKMILRILNPVCLELKEDEIESQ